MADSGAEQVPQTHVASSEIVLPGRSRRGRSSGGGRVDVEEEESNAKLLRSVYLDDEGFIQKQRRVKLGEEN